MTPFVSRNLRAAYVKYRDLDLGENDGVDNTSYSEAMMWGNKWFGDVSKVCDGYVRGGMATTGVELFRVMQMVGDGVRPNEITMVSVLGACSDLGALELGKWCYYLIQPLTRSYQLHEVKVEEKIVKSKVFEDHIEKIQNLQSYKQHDDNISPLSFGTMNKVGTLKTCEEIMGFSDDEDVIDKVCREKVFDVNEAIHIENSRASSFQVRGIHVDECKVNAVRDWPSP
nr:pentatricopeptide repeat-containing protein At4g21065-like [Tanacetum cinerariifolium]